jgi:hypothetical protein
MTLSLARPQVRDVMLWIACPWKRQVTRRPVGGMTERLLIPARARMLHSMGMLAGYLITDDELRTHGFSVHDLQVHRADVLLPTGMGCEWTTLGEVPDSPGLYAFTVDDGEHQAVTYVGMTTHLWMVTKGRLPRSGGGRGGQRYGRPRHAGATRVRINLLIAAEINKGHRIRHWLLPTQARSLAYEEEKLIRRWQLRQLGWNRG